MDDTRGMEAESVVTDTRGRTTGPEIYAVSQSMCVVIPEAGAVRACHRAISANEYILVTCTIALQVPFDEPERDGRKEVTCADHTYSTYLLIEQCLPSTSAQGQTISQGQSLIQCCCGQTETSFSTSII